MKATGLAFRTGFTSGVNTFKRVYDDPSMVEGGAVRENRSPLYATLWSYYDNSAFEDVSRWARYKGQYHLYRQIRSLYNPTRRLVDFYAGQVYPGILSEDGSKLPDGVPLAVPLAQDTSPELKAAIAQFWRWSNWQATKSVYVRYGAAVGNVLVEVDDDVARGRVAANVVWPGLITWLDLDRAGNVKAYVMEYPAIDDEGLRYIYRKEVDAGEYATFKNREPYDYTGAGVRWTNPYGFVPAVWVKHKEVGGDFGAPAMHGSLGKLDQVNSLASHIHDQVHKVIGAPVVLWSEGKPAPLFSTKPKRPSERDYTDDLTSDQETMLMLTGPAGGRVESLAGNLPLAEAMAIVTQLIGEIESDHPELALYRELRGMSQLTGPAANRVMGDVAGLLAESSASYDRGSIALFQMALAIGGWRAKAGDWGPLSRQQQLFAPFDLDSYAAGKLDFDIAPRPLVPLTEVERLTVERQKLAITVDQRAASLDPAALAATLDTAAQASMVRTVIPRGGA